MRAPPRSITLRIESSAMWIRRSSVTRPSSSGTLKSTRISTLRPATSISAIVFLGMALEL
jgi:hypothetical protein